MLLKHIYYDVDRHAAASFSLPLLHHHAEFYLCDELLIRAFQARGGWLSFDCDISSDSLFEFECAEKHLSEAFGMRCAGRNAGAPSSYAKDSDISVHLLFLFAPTRDAHATYAPARERGLI